MSTSSVIGPREESLPERLDDLRPLGLRHRVAGRVVARVVEEDQRPPLLLEERRGLLLERGDVEPAALVEHPERRDLALVLVGERLVRAPVEARGEQRLAGLEEVGERDPERAGAARGGDRGRRGLAARRGCRTCRRSPPRGTAPSRRSARRRPTPRRGPGESARVTEGSTASDPSSRISAPIVAFTTCSPAWRRRVASALRAKIASLSGRVWRAGMSGFTRGLPEIGGVLYEPPRAIGETMRCASTAHRSAPSGALQAASSARGTSSSSAAASRGTSRAPPAPRRCRTRAGSPRRRRPAGRPGRRRSR